MERPARVTALAACFVAGIGAAREWPLPCVWPALGAAVVALLTALGLLVLAPGGRGGRVARVGLLVPLGLAVAAIGHARMTLDDRAMAADDLAAMLPPVAASARVARVARVEGLALEGPVRVGGADAARGGSGGSMARFDHRPVSTVFRMRVDALVPTTGPRVPVRGRVRVRVADTVAPFRAGDRVAAIGHLRAPVGPRNPGGLDPARLARARGEAGTLHVTSRHLVRVAPGGGGGPLARGTDRLRAWRERVHRRAAAWLLDDPTSRPAAPGAARSDGRRDRDALLGALVLGRRDGRGRELGDAFRRVGLAHLLAISGLHLGLLAGIALGLLRLGGHPRPWHGALVVLVVAAYLVVVEVRLPLLRAGIMTSAAAIAVTGRRRLRVDGLLGLSAIALLAWRPGQLLEPGFQLSFGVVMGIVHLVPRVQRRWLGPGRRRSVVGRWAGTTLVVTTVAWAIATPLSIHHFGMIAPWAVPLSVVALPLVAVVLVLGFAKVAAAGVLPSVALVLGAPLAVGADLLVSIVAVVDALPGTTATVPRPSAAWTVAALAWVAAWGWERRLALVRAASAVALVAWLTWPLVPGRPAPHLRVDMLAVGDGSCFLVRSRDRTGLFDAGSAHDPDAGRRTIVPALRALGVRRVDVVMISHPNLDHFSAVLEVVDAFGVDRVVITPQFARRAADDPGSAPAHLRAELGRRLVAVEHRAAGDREPFGAVDLRWLHPPAAATFERENDGSMVIAIGPVLLTGDVEERGIETLVRAHPRLRAEVVELPHHGSVNRAARGLLRRLDPTVVMQSTGRARWERDGWAGDLADVVRLVTPRDGACWVECDRDGAIRAGRTVGATRRAPPR
jgi:competence protein ComEC